MSAAAFDFKNRLRRETLEGFQTRPNTPGGGTNASDQILLGVFFDPHNCSRLRARLSSAGISSSIRKKRREVSVFVCRGQRAEAFGILDAHVKQYPNERPQPIGRVYDFPILLVLVSSLATPLIGLSLSWPSAVAFWMSAASLAYIFGRIQRNMRWYGRYQFTVTEMLVLTAIIAANGAVWRIAMLFA